MKQVYKQLLLKLQEYLPNFKVANAVVHFDEASPHMHVVGVPVGETVRKPLRGDNRILNVGLSPKQS
ncbi:hypothetical protein C804_05346 [Lachnospiraceae bacterium A4]|nr:hypothetical protein C804_05346 [Lachnospiraceae bacterium A4]